MKTKSIAIIGAGISGVSLAYYLSAYKKYGIDIDITIFDRNNSCGGCIRSSLTDGYLVESGPTGVLNNREHFRELFVSAGLEDELLYSSPATARRYIQLEDELLLAPQGLLSAITTPLLPFSGKLRMLLEPFILANKTNDEGNEESVFQFAERRLGKYAAQNLISTLVGGIYAGNAHELSIRAAFPHLYELEKQYGSLVRGMLAKMFSAISSSDGCTRAQTHKHYELISSKRGMNGLVSALADKCSGVSLRYKTPIETISSVKSGGYTVTTPDGKQNFDMLAICCNANDMAAITSELSKEMSQQLSKIAFAPVFVCGMGFDELQLAHPLDAFGYLAAPKDGRIVLGTLFNSALFAGRAPEGKALVTVIAVGTRNRQAFSLSDEELQSTIYEQVKPALGVSGQPEFISSFRTEYALPQYDIWHNTTKTAVNNIAGALAGLYIGGNSFGGVSMSDCVLTSRNIADRIFFDIKCGTS